MRTAHRAMITATALVGLATAIAPGATAAGVPSAVAPKAKVSVSAGTHTAPKPISVAEYLKSGGDSSAAKAAKKCWSAQFGDTLSVTNWPFPGEFTFAHYGYTGKWCKSGSTLWRMAIMNTFVQPVGPGSLVFTKNSHRTVGRTVWNNKYAIGVEQFNMAGKLTVQPVGTIPFNFDRCIRSWGDGSGRHWQSRSCSVL